MEQIDVFLFHVLLALFRARPTRSIVVEKPTYMTIEIIEILEILMMFLTRADYFPFNTRNCRSLEPHVFKVSFT